MIEPELTHAVGFRDGRQQFGYIARCQCGASLAVSIVTRERLEDVRAYYRAWAIFHQGEGHGLKAGR